MPEQEPALAALDRAWDEAIRTHREAVGPRAILYSGGVDSSLVAWELRRRPETVLVTVGVAGASDLGASAAGAELIGLPWLPTTLEDESLSELRRSEASELTEVPPARQSLFLALAAAIRSAPPGGLLCGQGADELFLGYAHFRGLRGPEAEARAQQDLDQLVGHDWPWTQRFARRSGRSIDSPFLDPVFIRAAQRIPIEERLPDPSPKACLRRLAERRGVPPSLTRRPKRALQFGSGIDAWWRRRPVP